MNSVNDAVTHLRRRAEASGLSPAQIARLSGLRSAETVRAFLRGGHVTIKTIAAIERAMHEPEASSSDIQFVYRGKRHA